MLYHVKGLNRETGEPVVLTIEAQNDDDAIGKAGDRGIVVESVSLKKWPQTLTNPFTGSCTGVYRIGVLTFLFYICVMLTLLHLDTLKIKSVWVRGGTVDVGNQVDVTGTVDVGNIVQVQVWN